MEKLSIEIVGICFNIQADQSLVELLSLFYKDFQKPTNSIYHCDLEWEDLNCKWRINNGEPHHIRVAKNNFRANATTQLVTYLLIELREDLSIFHGNALWNSEDRRLLILLGDSGSGKSTLSHHLLNGSSTWGLLAEDLVILDLKQRQIHPFPRSACIPVDPKHKMTVRWPVISMNEIEKELRPYQQHIAERCSSQNAQILFLEEPPANPWIEQNDPEVVWTTYFDQEAAFSLREAGLPLKHYDVKEACTRLTYSRSLTNKERLRQFEIIFEQGRGMILHTEHQNHLRRFDPGRAKDIQYDPLKTSEGIIGMIRYWRRPPHRIISEPVGKTFIQLVQHLRNATFARFQPAGTPTHSVGYLSQLVRG